MSGGIELVDVARQAGLNYRFIIGGKRPMTILQTIGNGCAFLDYNRDGNLDILLVGNPQPKLYQGDGRGHFTDVSERVGFLPKLPSTPGAAWIGCAVGDYDNDGYPDIYLSGYRTAALFHNEHGQGYVDVTRRAGIHPEQWGTSCGFCDFDGDGRLDLFICNYVQFSPDPKKYTQLCNLGTLTGCGPFTYLPEKPTLYQNLGGWFKDVSAASGVWQASGKGLGVAFADCDGSGRPDILVANDKMAGDLLRNRGNLCFEDRGTASGVAFNPAGTVQGGMGADWGDYDNDGRLDAVVTTFENEPKSLYHNDGQGLFHNVTNAAGLGAPTTPWVGFGVKWLDLDNDGWLDLLIANGHVYDNIAHLHLSSGSGRYRQPMQAFHNLGTAGGREVKFADISAQLGPDLARPIVGRGLAVGDYDNDGRMDALVVDAEGPPLLLHNVGGKVGHWLGLSLEGTGRSNRDAIGARVTVRAGVRVWVKELQTAGSYLSSSDKRLLFGLGAALRADTLTVHWPDGKEQTWLHPKIDRYLQVTEKRDM